MEDRNRRCNLRIIGLAEGVEGSNVVQFLTNSLPEWETFMGRSWGYIGYIVTITTKPVPVLWFLIFFTLPPINTSQGQRGNHLLRWMDGRFTFYLITVPTPSRDARHSLKPWIPQELKELNSPYATLPLLKVKTGGQTELFHSPKDAEDFLNSLPNRILPSSLDGNTVNQHDDVQRVQPVNDE